MPFDTPDPMPTPAPHSSSFFRRDQGTQTNKTYLNPGLKFEIKRKNNGFKKTVRGLEINIIFMGVKTQIWASMAPGSFCSNDWRHFYFHKCVCFSLLSPPMSLVPSAVTINWISFFNLFCFFVTILFCLCFLFSFGFFFIFFPLYCS